MAKKVVVLPKKEEVKPKRVRKKPVKKPVKKAVKVMPYHIYGYYK